MAGFEVVVRPAVLPDIRPPPARSLPIEDAPDKGIAVINGIGNSVIDLSVSQQSSWSTTRQVEEVRHYDKVRIYASNADGTLDFESYIEYEVMTSIEYYKNGSQVIGSQFAPTVHEPPRGINVVERNLVRRNPAEPPFFDDSDPPSDPPVSPDRSPQ